MLTQVGACVYDYVPGYLRTIDSEEGSFCAGSSRRPCTTRWMRRNIGRLCARRPLVSWASPSGTGDDFVFVGKDEYLKAIPNHVAEHIKVKVAPGCFN